MKKISIIIPLYNAEDTIDYCIESICGQSIDKNLIEVIIVDDASRDDGLKICNSYAKKYDYIETLPLKENGGVSAARNAGVKKAQGEYLFFMDADDWMGPDCLSRLLKHIESREIDIVIGRVVEVDRKKKRGRVAWCRGNKLEYTGPDFENRWEFYASMGPWGRLVKRDLVVDNDIEFPTDLHMYEDVYWNMCLLHCAQSAAIVNDYDYYYLRRDTDRDTLTTNESSVTNSNKPEKVYHAVDKLSTLAETYGYGDDHPAWKRIFQVLVRDSMTFISTAARIEPEKYPNNGIDYKRKVWDRVKDYYSPWIRNNINTELLCRLDGMAAGLEYDQDDEMYHYLTNRYSQTAAAKMIQNCVIDRGNFPEHLSKEACERLLGEQAESYQFYVVKDKSEKKFKGEYFVPMKVSDDFDIEMRMHTAAGTFPLKAELKPCVWGEAHQEQGVWEAYRVDRLPIDKEGVKDLEFRVKIGEVIVHTGTISIWNSKLGKPSGKK
ncbi:MAG: glycosyltransferase family 2 protein [Mogibacterium sp.]|nr:glycosyltransferase family 2 protein [Mogibacterium sp.]